MRYMKCILVIAVSLALFACGKTGTATGTGVISLNGGTGIAAAGGQGGGITTQDSLNNSLVFVGDLKFHASGTVDASFAIPALTPNLGIKPAVITAETFVLTAPAPNSYFVSGTALHLADSTGADTGTITGLTVNAKLHLPNVPVVISGAIIINGICTVTADGDNLNLTSNSLLQINPGGKVTSTPSAGTSGQVTLTSTSGVLINTGIVESNGVTGGISGGVTLDAGSFCYNSGSVSAKGDGAGSGGPIQLLAHTASVNTSGIIDASGGNGTTGGNGGNITLSAGSVSVIGRVVVAGTLSSNGGSGSAGSGGNGGAVQLNSTTGGISVAASITANGGAGAGSTGGNGGTLLLNSAALPQASPQGIKVAGNISLIGGNGSPGGFGGTISVVSGAAANALPGFASVDFFGYQLVTLNGGASGSGDGGNGGTITGELSSAFVVNVNLPAGAVTNEVPIFARGGDANSVSGTGGRGGTVTFTTPQFGTADNLVRSIITNSGSIDISGGAGNIGGPPGTVTMTSSGNLNSSGTITANGGKGTTSGSDGGSVQLSSLANNVINSGGIVVIGGDGSTGGNGGSVSISSGNQTSTAGIAASGGNSTTGNGGNGGIINLSSARLSTVRSGLNVARGRGGSANSAINGTITIDLVTWDTALPLSGAI